MAFAFGGQRSIQLSYGCCVGARPEWRVLQQGGGGLNPDDRGRRKTCVAPLYWAVMPPSILNSEPVTKRLSSEAR